MSFFLKENYYADFEKSQLRITGPGNHLLCGISFRKDCLPEITDVKEVDSDLLISLAFQNNKISFSYPLVTDIRTLRNYTEGVNPKPSYKDLTRRTIAELRPMNQIVEKDTNESVITFQNTYIDEDEVPRFYGFSLHFSDSYKYKIGKYVLTFENEREESIHLRFRTRTNISISDKIYNPIFISEPKLDKKTFTIDLRKIYVDSKKNVEFLIRTKKTSSFEYGTIFPRDWIESADLGRNDLQQDTIDYMYSQSMRKISSKGEAWHEDIIGHYAKKIGEPSIHIDRKMIDIEPRYILGVPHLSNQFLLDSDNRKKLLLVSRYILENAKKKELITFKMRPGKGTGYHIVGNWRDSGSAFPSQKQPLAPYDVNCVFYPAALRIIRDFGDYFQIKKKTEIEKLIFKWEMNKERFRMVHPNGILGYSLAVHGKKYSPMPISHLDESYDLFYGRPSLQYIVSFAKKIIDPKFFYTPCGPLLVASDEGDFNSRMYHGKVIWPKQAAYAVAGLARQYRYGKEQRWPDPVLTQIKKSILVTCEACFRGWTNLGFVPELYIYDRRQKKAKLYTDQKYYEGQMSNIQLWSSVGARRIMKEYKELL